MEPPEPAFDALNEDRPSNAGAGRPLPAGSRLGGFEITGIIAEGGVTIVYAATDAALGTEVAIAEYMPAWLADRNSEGHVTPRSPAEASAFSRGLDAFVDETRTLARCDHPSLVRILGQWESNSTAYRVMPRYPATLLLHARKAMTASPDEASVRALLDGLLGALDAFHATGRSHGKVTPSNIVLLDDRRPLLLGPGNAARAIAGDGGNPPIADAETGFAPIEQIVEPDVEPPFSADLYALAGVARYWMTGELPARGLRGAEAARPDSVAAIAQRLSVASPGLHYSASLLEALDNALSIYPAQRPQTVAQMRDRLGAAPPVPPPPIEASPPIDAVDAGVPPSLADAPSPAPRRRRVAMWIYACFIGLALVGIGAHEYGQEYGLGRVLDSIGVGGPRGVADRAPKPEPAGAVPAPMSSPDERGSEPAAAATSTPTDPQSRASAPLAAPSSETASPPAADAPTSAEPTVTTPPPVMTTPPPAANLPSATELPETAPAPPAPAPQVAQPRAAREPSSPREACGDRTQFSLYRCMQRQCSQRQWASHAQCERLRRTDTVD
jgi:serine/threonine protein kinase